MNEYDIKRLALVFAVQAEIEGKKADNMQKQAFGQSMTWISDDFNKKAEELRNLAYSHNEQL